MRARATPRYEFKWPEGAARNFPPVFNGYNPYTHCDRYCAHGDRLSILWSDNGTYGIRFVFHNMHHIAPCILPEDLWERDQSQWTDFGLDPSDHILDCSHRRHCLGIFTARFNHCEINHRRQRSLSFCDWLIIVTDDNGKIVPCFAIVQNLFLEWLRFVVLAMFPELKYQLRSLLALYHDKSHARQYFLQPVLVEITRVLDAWKRQD